MEIATPSSRILTDHLTGIIVKYREKPRTLKKHCFLYVCINVNYHFWYLQSALCTRLRTVVSVSRRYRLISRYMNRIQLFALTFVLYVMKCAYINTVRTLQISL